MTVLTQGIWMEIEPWTQGDRHATVSDGCRSIVIYVLIPKKVFNFFVGIQGVCKVFFIRSKKRVDMEVAKYFLLYIEE